MKKFWNLMLAALVIFGAVACTEKEVAPEQNAGMSIYATINAEQTRVDVVQDENYDTNKKWNTIWTAGDMLEVYSFDDDTFFYFENSADNVNKFTCNEPGVNDLIGDYVLVSVVTNPNDYSTSYNSTKGKQGAEINVEIDVFDPANTINLETHTAFLRYSSNYEITLEASDDLFYDNDGNAVNTITLPASADDVWVAVWPYDNITFSYSIDGVKYKETTTTFVAGKIYNLGTLAPIYNVYVLPQPKSAISKWTKYNLYTWGNENINTWPGDDITANKKEINGYTYYAYQYPVEYNGQTVSVIVNNGSDQTSDIELGELNTDYYVVVNSLTECTVSTTAPAAGSVPEAKVVEDPKPDTVSLYLKTTWGWSNWALYAWGGSGTWGDFNKFPGKAFYSATIDGVTYKAWDIPDSCVGQTGTQIIVTGKEYGQTKQSVDFPVSFKAGEDVFIEISSWNGNLNKCELKTIASPYTK